MKACLLKITMIVSFALLFCNCSFSQQIIKEAGISFKLNDSLWKRNTSQNDNTKSATVYRYNRVQIETTDGKPVIPTIAVVIESIQDSTDIMVFSAMKKVKTPFDVEEIFTSAKGLLQYENAIGYRGGYSDRNGVRHSIIVIYLINKNKGVQMVMDITRELYDEYKGEFEDVIRSIMAI
jgi:hypothetical protein